MTEKEEVIKKLHKHRGGYKSRQTLFEKYLKGTNLIGKKDLKGTNKEIIIELESRLDDHIIVFSKFGEIQDEIELISENLEEEIREREDFQNKYFKLTSQAKTIIKEFYNSLKDDEGSNASVSQPSVSNNYLQGVKLPPVSLQKFAGDYKNWLEFRDLFDSLINSNSSIPNIQKFHYLRASLEGGAAQVIRSIELSGDNYLIAWNTLLSRYDNPHILVQNHIKSLFTLPVLTDESASALRNMIDTVSKHIQS